MSRQHETACTLTKTCLVFSGSKHGIFSQVPTKSFSRPVSVSSFINRVQLLCILHRGFQACRSSTLNDDLEHPSMESSYHMNVLRHCNTSGLGLVVKLLFP